MFYDEEMILDFRLNYLNDYVDKFVIVESSYTHSGKKRKVIFDIKKYSKFKDRWYPIRKNLNDKYLKNIDRKSQNFIVKNLNKELVVKLGYKI